MDHFVAFVGSGLDMNPLPGVIFDDIAFDRDPIAADNITPTKKTSGGEGDAPFQDTGPQDTASTQNSMTQDHGLIDDTTANQDTIPEDNLRLKLTALERNNLVWESHKEEIRALYVTQGKKLRHTMEAIDSAHGFSASVRKWKVKLKEWGFEKNVPTAEMSFMVLKAETRKRELGKDTEFTRHGTLVPPQKLETFKKTKLSSSDVGNMADAVTPAYILYATPKPHEVVPIEDPQVGVAENVCQIEAMLSQEYFVSCLDAVKAHVHQHSTESWRVCAISDPNAQHRITFCPTVATSKMIWQLYLRVLWNAIVPQHSALDLTDDHFNHYSPEKCFNILRVFFDNRQAMWHINFLDRDLSMFEAEHRAALARYWKSTVFSARDPSRYFFGQLTLSRVDGRTEIKDIFGRCITLFDDSWEVILDVANLIEGKALDTIQVLLRTKALSIWARDSRPRSSCDLPALETFLKVAGNATFVPAFVEVAIVCYQNDRPRSGCEIIDSVTRILEQIDFKSLNQELAICLIRITRIAPVEYQPHIQTALLRLLRIICPLGQESNDQDRARFRVEWSRFLSHSYDTSHNHQYSDQSQFVCTYIKCWLSEIREVVEINNYLGLNPFYQTSAISGPETSNTKSKISWTSDLKVDSRTSQSGSSKFGVTWSEYRSGSSCPSMNLGALFPPERS